MRMKSTCADNHIGAVNLADISGSHAPVKDHDNANYEAVFAVNVQGTFNCT
jgi:NAD(P)-dependent dehydrogenase (short-subunit alcohol dehydrogenase family)